MQKKSLLVMLFCGALCLTGCLKNEESASVAQVRIAKANELNSIADLNKAKAQAEVIYANAEATIANAEAKLREANAALVLAQAETEKVRAELLKVQVKLAEVKVEEEKIQLQMMEANLESRLAALEVEKAAAEAAKQGWINVLNDLVAQAEIDAVKNAHEILKAEQDLEAYILTLEGKKADSAKVYATLYFQSLDSVAVYQAKYIAAKAAKVLINRGALDVREYIYDEMGKNNDTIAVNNARIAYLKEYQTASPEEIKAQMEEAWKEVNDAYAVYMAAVEASKEAETAMDDAAAVKSTYVEDWSKNFGDTVKWALQNLAHEHYSYAQYQFSDNVYVDEETGVTYNAYVKFDENGEVVEIVPLWTASAPNKEQYFDEPVFPEVIDGIYQKYPSTVGINYAQIQNRTYYPAKIEFDNIQKVFTAYEEMKEAELEKLEEDFADTLSKATEQLEDRIAGLKVAKKYFQDYVTPRAAMVEEAEQALMDSIEVANKTHGAFEKAWNAYRDYMVMKYDVNRRFFEDRYNAQNASKAADTDSTTWEGKLTDAKAKVAPAKAELEKAVLLAHEKHGAWRKAVADTVAAKESAATDIANAKKSYNPDFDPQRDTVWVDGALYNTTASSTATHSEKEAGKIENSKAGTAQVSVATAKTLMDEKAEALRNAKWLAAYWKGYGNTEKATQYSTEAETLEPQYTTAVSSYNAAVTAENTAKEGYEAAASKLTKAKEAEAKALAELKKAVVDSEQLVDENDKVTTKGKYVAAVKDTVSRASEGFVPVEEATDEEFDEATAKAVAANKNYTTGQKADYFAKRATYMAGQAEIAEKALLNELAAKLNVDPKDIASTADEKADELYQAMVDAWKNGDPGIAALQAAYGNLMKVYYYCLDQDYRGWFENEFYWANASYQLDPEYQLISGIKWNEEEGTYEVEKSYRRSVIDPETGERVGDRSNSVAGLLEDAEALLADEEKLEEECMEYFIATACDGEDPWKAFEKDQKKFATVTANLAKYEAVENAYVASVEDRNTTHAAWVEAKIEELFADALYKIEREEYLALKDIANEGVWVYDPEYKIYAEVYGIDNEDGEHMGEFTFIPIAMEIENLEKDNERLEQKNEDLKQLLSDGKTALAVVNEALDQIIDTLKEAIDIWTAIANKYKAIMNGYLGIVDEADVEGETGPLDGEGDDEE